ncbi:glycosyltransferase family 4 protein [Azospirillum sp. sgz301742]
MDLGTQGMRPLVHVFGHFSGRTGYSVHAINFARALARRCNVLTTEMTGGPAALADSAAQLAARHAAGQAVYSIAVTAPDDFPALAGLPGRRIGFFVWERDALPDRWLPQLADVDRVWTASRWGKGVIAAAGVPEHRIDVVPEGFDPAVFSPEGPALPALARDPRFKLLTVGKFEERKNTAGLIRAFAAAFADTQDAALVLSCTNAFLKDFDLSREVERLAGPVRDRILLARWVDTPDTLGTIYRACDAFVAPSRAEGWGLPIMEAMACGLPTITTGYSAMTEYATPENAVLLDYTLVPAPACPLAGHLDRDGRWAEPDAAQLARAMRALYEDRARGRALGARAASYMAAGWTWDHAADAALRTLEALDRDEH